MTSRGLECLVRGKELCIRELHKSEMEKRPRSSRPPWKGGRRLTSNDLHDLAKPRDGLSSLTTYEPLSKSAVEFLSASREVVRRATKQAWAPPVQQSLSSSSDRFRGETPLPPHPSTTFTRAIREFGRAEDHIGLEDLIRLRRQFEEADKEGTGVLDEEEFMAACDQLFDLKGKNQEELRTFFYKIDYNSDGFIDWDEFCTYMYLELHERDDTQSRTRKVEFHCPAVLCNGPHKDPICRITNTSDGALVSCSQDGVVCLWTPSLELKRVKNSESGQTGKPRWITDMALCLPQSKILLTTGHREIQFYEMVNFEPYCQLRRLDAVPLRLHFWSKPKQENECIILVGDQEGSLTVFTIPNITEAFRIWKLGPKMAGGMPTFSIDRLVTDGTAGIKVYRWKLHSNWVSEVHYFAELQSFATCACDPSASMVVGSPAGSTQVDMLLRTTRQTSVAISSSTARASLQRSRSSQPPPSARYSAPSRAFLPAKIRARGDQRVFSAPKGVSTLDYCPKNNVIVTGSVDQIIRIWNPFLTSKPTACLPRHGAPVFSVKVESANNRIYSIGNDNTIMVWDIVDHHCLCTIIPSAHKVFTAVQAIHFNPVLNQLVLGTEQLAVLKLVLPPGFTSNRVLSHTYSVSAAKFSRCFNQVITACEGSEVKVWNVCTGECVFQFSTGSPVSAIDVDLLGRRMVSGGHDGSIKLWNYNNGHCIRTLDKGANIRRSSTEVSDVKFVSINQNSYILTVGWDRKVNLFADIAESIQHIQRPIEAWSASTENAHTDDILTVAFGAPHLMATASFDGEIIVWSVVSSHVLCRLKADFPSHLDSHSTLQGDEAVQKLVFLDQRSTSRDAATLVASGPSGYVHFWNVHSGTKPMGYFLATQSGCVTAMAVDCTNTVLITGDLKGFVTIWNITEYCISSQSTTPPRQITLWRAHTEKITCVCLIEEWNVMVSTSCDCTARLWTLEGHYIGTFGQEGRWRLGDPATYQHPLSPSDVLLDPQTVPEIESPEEEAQDIDKTVETQRSLHEQRQSSVPPLDITDVDSGEEQEEAEQTESDIAFEVPARDLASAGKVGKRLRHLRTMSAKRHSGRLAGVYTSLPCHPLTEEPQFQLPDTIQT